jgi:peptidoglycan/LPS O-acetylase OafA/YrhL
LKRNYIPALDGWRAIAVSLVLFAHSFPSIFRTGDIRSVTLAGILGVRIFFGLSGFLITSMLLAEENASGKVDIRSFYRRRFFRIAPAAVTLLMVVGLFSTAGAFDITLRRWIDVMFFFANYSSAPYSYTLGHFWSLAVEEHFYFLWPALFVALATFRKRISVAVSICLAVAIWRAIAWKYQITTADNAEFWGRTDINVDAILWGAVIAILVTQREARTFLLSYPVRKLTTIGYLFLLSSIFLATGWKLNFALNDLTLIIGPILIFQTSQLGQGSMILRAFEYHPVKWIGRISYSLYLWQQLFLTPKQDGVLQVFPINVLAAICCATASYYLIEKPVLAWSFRRSQHALVSYS